MMDWRLKNLQIDACRLHYTEVICILRGEFVEEVADILDPDRNDNREEEVVPNKVDKEPPPFVHLRYVMRDVPYSSGEGELTAHCILFFSVDWGTLMLPEWLNAIGKKVVRCVQYASRMKVDPNIPEVKSLKESMLGLDFID